MLFEKEQSAAEIADHHTDDRVIDRIAGADGINVDFRAGQLVAYFGEHAGAVIEEDCELFCDLHTCLELEGFTAKKTTASMDCTLSDANRLGEWENQNQNSCLRELAQIHLGW